MIELIDGRNQRIAVHIERPRPVGAADPLEAVNDIVQDVRLRGDAALIEHTERLNGAALSPEQLRVDPEAVARERSLVRTELIEALELAARRLRAVSERALPKTWLERTGGDVIGELIRPLRRVGICVPETSPSTVIMAAIPARVAGVETVAVASPPARGGEVYETVLAACGVAGVDEVYAVGGAQAIAALAYGTESVRPVDKIVAPGSIYAALAKRLVSDWVGVDSHSGPSEIAIVADASSDPDVVAADLIAQAERGALGTHTLVTWSEELAHDVIARLETHVLVHENSEDVENALIEGGSAVIVSDLDQALATVNALAPQNVELLFEGAEDALDRIRNAGAVFVGPYSAVAVGDYVAGTNRVLPSGGAARFSSGLGVHDFLKRTYVFGSGPETLRELAPQVDALADAEGLPGHARAVWTRLERGNHPR